MKRFLYLFIPVLLSPAFAQAPWPGQTGNAVGYAAYGTLGTTTWPGGGFTWEHCAPWLWGTVEFYRLP